MKSIIYQLYDGNIANFAFNYASNIYNIPEVRTAIEAFADICSTIPIYHERIDKKSNITYLNDEITLVLSLQPNKMQNATQFWKSVYTQLLLYNNVFIEPIFDERTWKLKELYPLPYKRCQFEYVGNEACVKFVDSTDQKLYPLSKFIYLNRFASLSKGGAMNDLGLYEMVMQALMQQAVSVANPKKPRALIRSSMGAGGQAIKEKDRKGVLQDVKSNWDDNVEGMMYIDGQWEVTPINWQENDVNRELMKFVVNIV